MIYTLYRLYKAGLVSSKYAQKVFRQALVSRETATFTYNLTPQNERYLLHLTAQILKTDKPLIERYFDELKNDEALRNSILQNLENSPFKKKKDKRCDYGNKLALYAMVRTMKPKLVVENGVEVGFTSIVLCEALRKNSEEGHNGKFIGLDINKDAGFLLKADERYNNLWEMRIGDAIECLNSFEGKIDFYFSDGYRSYDYEKKEFAALEGNVSEKGIVITNKASFSEALLETSLHLNRQYAFFKEQPQGHWYEGAGLGIMYA